MPTSGGLRQELLRKTHDLEMMLALISRSYYWPKMGKEVEEYLKSCLVCQQDKTSMRNEVGLLQPLSILDRPWQSISMDFISGLCMVDGFKYYYHGGEQIFKIFDFHSYSARMYSRWATELFFKNVVKYFVVPGDIVSDWDSRFTVMFWTMVFNMIDFELKFSAANHS